MSSGVRHAFTCEPVPSNLNANEFKRATRISLGDGNKARCFSDFCAARVAVTVEETLAERLRRHVPQSADK